MSTTVSIPGGNSAAPLIFKITGTSASNYATQFQNQVLGATGQTINILSNPGVVQTSVGSVLNEIFSNSSTTNYALAYGGQHTLVDVGAPTTVTGSTAGADTVLATGVATYDAGGSNNIVTFIDGTNTYNGSTVAGATGDTITGGNGSDTINTGAGYSTVFSGSGHTTINLNDTVASIGAPPGGNVYLGDGHAIVNANGVYDDVVTGTNGQTIDGANNTNANSTLNVVIGDNATSTGAAGDLISGGAGHTYIFDSVGGNTVFGGSGPLTFIGLHGASTTSVVSDTLVGSTGTTTGFLAGGDNVVFADSVSTSSAFFVAGDGNETLNAANATGNVAFFGSTVAGSTSTFVGSTTGNNYFQTGGSASVGGPTIGGANEVLVGGKGVNEFGIADGGPNAHITIFDFAAGNDSVNFLGETAAQVTADLNAAMVGNINGTPDLTVTLSDKTTVTFVGISSLTGHIVGHTGS